MRRGRLSARHTGKPNRRRLHHRGLAEPLESLARDAGAKPFLEQWHSWELAQRVRDGEEIDPEERFRPTLHGLRSTAVVMRRMAGYRDEQISNDVGMSLPMVRRYSRFIDQRLAAENNIVLLEERKKRQAT